MTTETCSPCSYILEIVLVDGGLYSIAAHVLDGEDRHTGLKPACRTSAFFSVTTPSNGARIRV
jgi:hypothetical protein